MSDATRGERSTLNRRQVLRLSTAAGLGAALPRPAGAANAAAPPEPPTGRQVQHTSHRGSEDAVRQGARLRRGRRARRSRACRTAPSTGGENRWLPAKPPAPWDGEYPALIYGANCPQRLHNWVPEQTFLYQWTDGWQSEDMLKVNIWTPSLTGSRPVMVYIHGGGFTFGSAYELASQDGAQMARHHDVVSVTVNHRLNILGFLDLSEFGGPAYADSANVGMTDLVAALQWVRDNIANFGGDPDRVMIYGQSGGGSKVTTLLGMPSAAGAGPSRVGAVGRWRQSALGRAVARAHQAADRGARRQGHGRAAEDGLGPAERRRQRRGRGDEPAAGPGGGPDTAAGIGAARRLGTDRRRPDHHDAVVLRGGAAISRRTCRC